MRKVFWCSLAGGIMLTGGVFTVAFFAARHPQSLTGRVVLGAGQAALNLNPLTGFTSSLAQIEKLRKGEPVAEKAVAAEVVGGEEQAEPVGQVEVAEGVIHIPETDAVCPEPLFDHLVQAVRSTDTVECPAAPIAMPPCTDDACEAPVSQVKACTTCEKLPMPSIEAGEEEQEETQQGTGAIERLFEMFDQATHKATQNTIDPVETAPPEMSTPECREDPNAYQHHSGCPAMGHCIKPRSQPTVPSMPPVPAAKPGSEESSEPSGMSSHSSALRAIRRFSMRGIEDNAPTHPEVDTMEYRTSDGQLYDLGPGGM